MGLQIPPDYAPYPVVHSGIGRGHQLMPMTEGPDPDAFPWDCDPEHSYYFLFYHESGWDAYVTTYGYTSWDPVAQAGRFAYGPARDLYMEGSASSAATRGYIVGGIQDLLEPIRYMQFRWNFASPYQGGVPDNGTGYADGHPPPWEFVVLESVPVGGYSAPDEPCPPDPPWPYRGLTVVASTGVIAHRRVIGSSS